MICLTVILKPNVFASHDLADGGEEEEADLGFDEEEEEDEDSEVVQANRRKLIRESVNIFIDALITHLFQWMTSPCDLDGNKIPRHRYGSHGRHMHLALISIVKENDGDNL